MSTRPARVRFVFRGGREQLVEDVRRGLAPDEFLYGMNGVARAYAGTGFVEARGPRRLLDHALRPLEFVTGKLGFPLFLGTPLRRLAELRAADVLVATTDSTGLPLLALKRLGVLRARIFVISQGLHSALDESAAPRVTKASLDALLAAAAGVVVLGDGDAAAFRAVFPRYPASHVHLLQFGIDADFWQPAAANAEPGRDPFILSVGSDHLRDYPTLLRAAGADRLRIVTRLTLPADLIGARTTIESHVSWPELRALYQQSRCVVIPVRDQPRDSGHSAALQAMACGKAVILSNTRGLWDRAGMRHAEHCWLVEPGDPAAMRVAIDHLSARPEEAARIGRNARALVESRYTSSGFAQQLAALIAA